MALNQIKLLKSPAVSVTKGSPLVTLTGSINAGYVANGTAIWIGNHQLVEAKSGTSVDGSGNSTITLLEPWPHDDVVSEPLAALNSTEGLGEAIRGARSISDTTLMMLEKFEQLVNSAEASIDIEINGELVPQVPYGYLAQKVQALIDLGDGAVDTLVGLQTGVANLQGTVDTIQADLDGAKNAAAVSAAAAKVSETNAETSETNSKGSEDASAASAAAALASESAAGVSETNAETKAGEANASQLAAKSSEIKAKTSEINAKASETNSKNSETNSALSASDALASKTAAASSTAAAAASATSAAGNAELTAADVLASQAEVVKSQQAVADARQEVLNAKAEVEKAKGEVINAQQEVINAADQVSLAQAQVSQANSAKLAAEIARAGAESAEGNVNNGIALAQQYANHPVDTLIPGTSEYSAFHWQSKTKQLADGTAPDSFKLGGIEAGDYYHVNNKPSPADVGALSQESLTSADLGYIADLNEISDKTVFCSLSGNYLNSPLGDRSVLTGQLMVMKRKLSGGFAVYQQLMASDRIWWRRGNGSPLAWSEWAEFYTQANKPTVSDIGAAPSGEYLVKGADLSGTADLNVYTSTGIYHQNSNSGAATGSHYPTDVAGMLTVMSDGYMTYQTYHTYDGSGKYQRTRYNNSWHPWDQVYDSGNKPTPAELNAYSQAEVDAKVDSLKNQVDAQADNTTRSIIAQVNPLIASFL
ncbi:pyocin knob domain-containing protein [Thalassomonas haliotis]|uniref:Uncharacterized protein n=1 Tax=Thalassomonas haliotis TaxID=485448 RepID=A0ABY7VFB5_9GAMM|nr:hypothetical protein [Thalassomonas haliotis]WDE11337.1 hypothetical protein H3N35_24465 [Thalassomonas haliotis]